MDVKMDEMNRDESIRKQDGVYSRKEAAEFLGVNLVTLWRLTRDRSIPYHRAGRRMFFLKDELLSATLIKEELQ